MAVTGLEKLSRTTPYSLVQDNFRDEANTEEIESDTNSRAQAAQQMAIDESHEAKEHSRHLE
ncbi:hypothetical protein MMC29_002198 [Sticta canariensis]|nr:hypothetical protein [Sticta canariensis]